MGQNTKFIRMHQLPSTCINEPFRLYFQKSQTENNNHQTLTWTEPKYFNSGSNLFWVHKRTGHKSTTMFIGYCYIGKAFSSTFSLFQIKKSRTLGPIRAYNVIIFFSRKIICFSRLWEKIECRKVQKNKGMKIRTYFFFSLEVSNSKGCY